jgi:hypothetical protein
VQQRARFRPSVAVAFSRVRGVPAGGAAVEARVARVLHQGEPSEGDTEENPVGEVQAALTAGQ